MHSTLTENLIGKGGHAEVYRGCLSDGQLVAVKKLMKKEKEEEERTADFLSELGIIAHIDHPNAARLIGFGVEGGLHLVLQLSPQGSLASVLHGDVFLVAFFVPFTISYRFLLVTVSLQHSPLENECLLSKAAS